jgi:hypothetical protein
MVFLGRTSPRSLPYWLKPLVAVLAYALALYLVVLVVALWFLGLPFLGPVALTGAVVCGAGGLIGSVLALTRNRTTPV